MRTLPIIAVLALAATAQSCENKTQRAGAAEHFTLTAPGGKIKATAIPTVFKSPLRPNEKLTLGKTYTDTVTYSTVDDNGDNILLVVQKNDASIGLIANQAPTEFAKEDQLEIHWKMDIIRYAGDSEFLNYHEFLLTARKISTSFPARDFSKIAKQSFVISCGTACAMTYNPKEIKQVGLTSIRVLFDVETHVDQQSVETFPETYIFRYGNTLTIERVMADGTSADVAQDIPESALLSFQEFGKTLGKQSH